MKTQMRFQKYLCLVVLILGALALVYSFCYSSGALSKLNVVLNNDNFTDYVAEGKNDASIASDIQGFNNILMYCGIALIGLAVILYITACNKRRNYYVSNYVATGVVVGGNIAISLAMMIMNGMWLGEFRNVDFEAWKQFNADGAAPFLNATPPRPVPELFTLYSDSEAWFIVGFVVYALVIAASLLLILNLVWKITLMRGEKQLLNGANTVEGGAAV